MLKYEFLKTILMNYDGISAVVKEIIDYGTEKFAVCAVGDKLAINILKIDVVESGRSIRII